MEQKNKLTTGQKQLLVGLYSSDDKIVIKSIKDTREKGGTFVIEPLMELYFTHKSTDVYKEIPAIFSDLKDSKLNLLITDNLLKYKGNERLSVFISSLWQSSVKFEDIKSLVEIFISGDDSSSLETLTLIQQNADMLNDAIASECLNILKSELSGMNDFKKTLAVDLLEILE